MTSTLDIIFPKTADNEYRGGAIAFYGFCLFVAAGFFRSTVHLLLPDGGINSIASIIIFEGTPNPNDVIYMLQSGGGAFQMSFAALNALVLWRYRSLIPLMLALMLMQQFFICMVQIMHPLTPDHYTYTPPAFAGAVPALIALAVLLYLAVRKSKAH
ncbi:hypothetical protein EYC87_17555 [Halieaceae bacterium IMCC8485]|jgi:hypothetical protein|uniref:Uncharacterized protein n=1 Tax=Candidatus Seongchinamella marina TaxID=2518990 RepID=A0ABT3SZP7_9GAMM|nr:hypothetical protein [Candidatus Seongchinamella marina]MCX2975390.1 hypothetical protein [Candidatus Seongchinamella marina]